jgi:putative sigma-54 modulation protein
MQLSITGHHVEVSDFLRNYVTEKFERLERHYDHITNVHVVLSVEKLVQKAEATVHTSGAEIFADATSEDMYAAIDSLIDKLDRQVLKHKEKTARRKARGK